jgi:hypothetical protein
MPRACTVCVHADRPAIDQALVNGKGIRETSALFRVSEDALSRHKEGHIPETLARAAEAEEVARADGLLGQLATLQADARRIGGKAETAGDLRTALAGIRELVRIVELTAKMIGELDDRPQVNVLVAPEWLTVRAALLEALRPYPEARQAVARRLVTLEATA